MNNKWKFERSIFDHFAMRLASVISYSSNEEVTTKNIASFAKTWKTSSWNKKSKAKKDSFNNTDNQSRLFSSSLPIKNTEFVFVLRVVTAKCVMLRCKIWRTNLFRIVDLFTTPNFNVKYTFQNWIWKGELEKSLRALKNTLKDLKIFWSKT